MRKLFWSGMVAMVLVAASPSAAAAKPVRIIFLHHSSGGDIWKGGVEPALARYNKRQRTDYRIEEQAFPREKPYGWNNYPYDYWNIWVKHAGPLAHRGEPTLEILTRAYEVIIFKHCFPVSNIEPDAGRASVSSAEKTLQNYKLQYAALKQKMRAFPRTKFLLWTGAANVKANTSEAEARRAKAFFDWVKGSWDEKGDNIYLWDFYQLGTEGGLFLKPANANNKDDSHPSDAFAARAAPLLVRRLVAVIEGRGDRTSLTGQ